MQLGSELGQRPAVRQTGLQQPHGLADRRVNRRAKVRHRALGPHEGPAQQAEQQGQAAHDVAAVLGDRAVPQRLQRGQVGQALAVGGRVQVHGEQAAALRRVRPAPQQVPEQLVLPGPGQLPAQQLAGEAAVEQLQAVAVLIAVPDARPEQHHVAGLQRLAAGQRVVRAGPANGERDLHEAVRVQRVRVGVEVAARVGHRAFLGEVKQIPARVQGHVLHPAHDTGRSGQS